jgi:hypothetical protein
MNFIEVPGIHDTLIIIISFSPLHLLQLLQTAASSVSAAARPLALAERTASSFEARMSARNTRETT